MGGKRRKMIIGLQCSSTQKAAGFPNEMAECWIYGVVQIEHGGYTAR